MEAKAWRTLFFTCVLAEGHRSFANSREGRAAKVGRGAPLFFAAISNIRGPLLQALTHRFLTQTLTLALAGWLAGVGDGILWLFLFAFHLPLR